MESCLNRQRVKLKFRLAPACSVPPSAPAVAVELNHVVKSCQPKAGKYVPADFLYVQVESSPFSLAMRKMEI